MKQLPGAPTSGLKTVGQIVPTNALVFHAERSGLSVAIELVATFMSGAPVVTDKGEFIGFISELDVLRALAADKDLSQVTAADIMAKARITVTDDTPIKEAVKVMEEKRLLNLPVRKNGKVAYSITRHDLLREWIGLELGI